MKLNFDLFNDSRAIFELNTYRGKNTQKKGMPLIMTKYPLEVFN